MTALLSRELGVTTEFRKHNRKEGKGGLGTVMDNERVVESTDGRSQ